MKKVLLTGATGYIGRRLKDRLMKNEEVELRLLVRNKKKLPKSVRDRLEVVEGDTFNGKALAEAARGTEVAFYLVHSMGSKRDFEELDRISARNFRDACIRAGVKRIVYLGGLGVRETASKHLASRIETGEILSARPDKINTIWFRAGVIIGSGSASFEIIRNLVQKLPLMIAPRWLNTKTQPIAVSDVLSYLTAAVFLETERNLVVDIGSDEMSFKEMLEQTAKVMELERVIFPVSLLTPKLSSYWLIFFTPVPYRIAAALVEGLKSETIKQNDNAARYFPQIKPMSFEQAVRAAIQEIENDQVVSRWCDSSAGEVCDVKYQEDMSSAVFRDVRRIDFGDVAPAKVFKSFTSVGGKRGWANYNFLWKLRGGIDKALGGYGLGRGRRKAKALRVGDALDFWKVVDIKQDKRLLLLSQMRLPGKAWLEFSIEDHTLVQTNYFYPDGVLGRFYWYQLMPLHNLVFEDLAKSIVERAASTRKS